MNVIVVIACSVVEGWTTMIVVASQARMRPTYTYMEKKMTTVVFPFVEYNLTMTQMVAKPLP
jgi:hypothetical protein